MMAMSTAVQLLQLAATCQAADQGSEPSRVQFFTTTRPARGAAAGADPQFVILLDKPCGSIVSGELILHPADANGVMVQSSGIPRWARWLAGDGTWIADGDVSDLTHDGDWQIGGGTTPTGDTSPMLYAGGIAYLGAVALT